MRDKTMSRWQQCENLISAQAGKAVARGVPYFLTVDHNDHSGDRFNPKGFRRIGGHGIDYIGVRLPEDWKLQPSDKGRAKSVSILNEKMVPGTIDRHDFYGARVLIVYTEQVQLRFWLVTANLGRGEPVNVFERNVRRIKRAFPKEASFGFQEIDEADRPREHEELRQEFPRARMVGWGTMNPIVTKRLMVRSARITKACDGLARYPPTRMLAEGEFEVKGDITKRSDISG